MRRVGGSGGALPDRGGELKARERAVPPAEDDSYQLPEPLIDALRALAALAAAYFSPPAAVSVPASVSRLPSSSDAQGKPATKRVTASE
jgi:hypothetical protein